MNDIVEVKRNIRDLENKIKDIQQSVNKIYSNIDKIMSTDQDIDIDYDKIKVLSNNLSFGNHPINKLNNKKICEVYIKLLLNIVRFSNDEKVKLNRFVLIQWLYNQSKIQISLEDLYKDCFRNKFSIYYEMISLIPKIYQEYFIVDALIIANISGTANTDVYDYIAGLISIINIDKNRIRDLSIIAKIALCQKVYDIKNNELDKFKIMIDEYKHYIKPRILEERFKKLRRIIVELEDSKVRNFKWKVQQGQEVKKNMVIATYNKSEINKFWGGYTSRNEDEKILSPSSGNIFQFRYNCINYGVLSHKSDSKDSIKAWVKSRI